MSRTMTIPPAVRTYARPGITLIRRAAGRFGCVVAVDAVTDRVVLTFDDGPEPGGTDPVLAALAQARARATFFVLLTRTRRYRSLLDEIVSAGHEIALHGADHRPLTGFAPGEVRSRCTAARAELEDQIGRAVTWLRPPYGRQTFRTDRQIRAAGLTPVLWGPSVGDTVELSHQHRVQRAATARGGSILLAHDGFAGPEDNVDDGPAPDVDRGRLVRDVLAQYADRGLRGCALGDVLAPAGARSPAGGRPVREVRYRR